MKRAQGHGFFVSVLINMLFRMGWVVAALALLALHFIARTPIWLMFIPLGCWVIHAMLVTILVSAAVRAGSEPTPKRPNKNPYSKKNSDLPSHNGQ